MRIIVTGGAGFIGSHVVDRLLKDGHTVLVLDDLSLGTKKNIEHNLNHASFSFKEMDVEDLSVLSEVFGEFKPECVFHLAANSDINSGASDLAVDLQRTFGTSIAVIEAMKEHGVKNLVFSSTSAVHGERSKPIPETENFQPISNYGAAKAASEAFISAFANLNGARTSIFRFANVCGPRSTHGVFVNFIRFLKKDPTRIAVARDGNQAKPYVHVLDLVDAIMLGWQKGPDLVNIFNIGNGPVTSVNEILQALLREMNIKDIKIDYSGEPAWPGDVLTYTLDDAKLRKLGFKPKFNSPEAVKETARALVHDPEAAINI